MKADNPKSSSTAYFKMFSRFSFRRAKDQTQSKSETEGEEKGGQDAEKQMTKEPISSVSASNTDNKQGEQGQLPPKPTQNLSQGDKTTGSEQGNEDDNGSEEDLEEEDNNMIVTMCESLRVF